MSIEDYLTIVTAVITIANVITSMTPSKSDNLIMDKILKILNIVSLNIGKNKNADVVEQSVLCNIKPEISVNIEDLKSELIEYWRKGEWKKESQKSDDV